TGLKARAIRGSGWTCPTPPTTAVICTRSDALAINSSYPSIVLTVSVDGSASATVFNSVNVTGGGDSNTHFFTDVTNINVPDLSITKSHTGNFVQGQNGAVYTINVSNVGVIPTAGGTVRVTDSLPFGLTATSASGTGWTCSSGPTTFMTCTRDAGALAQNQSYPSITLTVNVAQNAPTSVTNFTQVAGIGDANPNNNSASDVTSITPAVSIVPVGPTSVTVNAGSPAAYTFTANLVTSP